MVRNVLTVTLAVILCLSATAAGKNYVNWKGEFWLTMPDGWDKVDYREVDRILASTDTSSEVFNYEAVLAPTVSRPFTAGPYVVITFEPSGEMNDAQADSLLRNIAASYADDIFEAPAAARLSDLKPGQPRLNTEERTVQVLSEMAFSNSETSKLWLYLKLNHVGLIAFYMYCPESRYDEIEPLFESMINSLAFEGLKDAAGAESVKFTDVRGNETPPRVTGGNDDTVIAEGVTAVKNWIYIGIGVIIIAGLIWYLVIVPRRKKHQEENGSD